MNVRPALLTGGAVLLLVAAALFAYLWLPPRQTDEVAVPADDATPEQVVRAYVAALNAHDCETAEAVSAEEFDETAASWCHRVSALGSLEVGEPSSERPEWSGLPADRKVMGVPVTFDLDWRPWRGDGSMPEEETTWGFRLVRSSDTEPWRIFSQGVG